MLSSFRKLGWLSLGVILFLVGCGSDSAKLRVMQASPDESSVDVLIDGKSVATNVAYATATKYLTVSSGSRHLQVEPSGSTTVIVDQSLSLSGNSNSTVLVYGLSPSITALDLADDDSAPTSGDFKIRLVNAAPLMGAVDIFVVTPGTNLTDVGPNVTNLTAQAASGYLSFAAGTYEVFFTVPGGISSFIDSGPITFSTGQVRTMVALDGQAGGFTFSTLPDLN